MIYNDRDAIILDQLLISRPTHGLKANDIIIYLEGTTAFTETGASNVAKCLRAVKQNEKPIVRVKIASNLSDFTFVLNVATILYLQGNKPELHVHEPFYHRHSHKFNNLCRRLRQNHRALRMYFMKGSISEAKMIQFGISLHGNTALQTLELWVETYSFTIDHAHALAAGICNSALTTLIIYNLHSNATGVDGDKLKIICQNGIQASGRKWNLTICTPSEGRLDTSALAEIAPCLDSLTLNNVNIGLPNDQSHLRYLSDRLRGPTSNLLGLTLRLCRLDDGAMTILASGLHNQRSMTTLNLADNRIGDDSIAAFVENWPEDSKLELLDLRDNLITTVGLERLMTALPNRHAMKTLMLRSNAFGFDGVEMIGNHLPNLRLKDFRLGGTSILSSQVTRTRAMHSLLRGIKANYFLQNLDIQYYSFPRLELTHEITFYTKLNLYGRHLLTLANDVPPALWCLLFAKARIDREFSPVSIIFYFLVEQPHLVNERKGRKRRKRQTSHPTRRSARLRIEKS